MRYVYKRLYQKWINLRRKSKGTFNVSFEDFLFWSLENGYSESKSYYLISKSPYTLGDLKFTDNNVQSTHKKTGTRLYRIWKSMRCRCNPNSNNKRSNISYSNKDIMICDDWNSFLNFEKWSLNNGYKDSLSIERENNDLGYNPDNCIWASEKVQAMNRRTSKYWFVDGLKFNSSVEAGKNFNVSPSTILEWCNGRKRNGRIIPPKENCYSEFKYKIA